MGFSWVATEMRTGKLLAELPNLLVPTVKQSLCQYEQATATLPINTNDAPPEWPRATLGGASTLVLLADNPSDPAHGIPVAGYDILRPKPDETDLLQLDLVTGEAYLDRRYVGDKTYSQVGQNDIIADLINSYILDGAGGLNGVPIRVQYVTAGGGTLRDRTYTAISDKTVYSAITELAGVLGGIEFYVGWEWQFNPDRLTRVLYVGSRVGIPVTPGLNPNATFEMPGTVTKFQIIPDWSSGKAATSVTAVSTANGNVRPQSPAQIAVDPQRPTYEYRYTPSTSITDVPTLTAHAQASLANMDTGALSISMTSTMGAGLQLGVDFSLGDDIGFSIGGLNADGTTEKVPSVPGGVKGHARMIGTELTLADTLLITPILANPVYQ
jgi:hypothetical protein